MTAPMSIHDRSAVQGLRVGQVMRPYAPCICEDLTLAQAAGMLHRLRPDGADRLRRTDRPRSEPTAPQDGGLRAGRISQALPGTSTATSCHRSQTMRLTDRVTGSVVVTGSLSFIVQKES